MTVKLTAARLTNEECSALTITIYNELKESDEYFATDLRRETLIAMIMKEIDLNGICKKLEKINDLSDKITSYTVDFSEEVFKHLKKIPNKYYNWNINILTNSDPKDQIYKQIKNGILQYNLSTSNIKDIVSRYNLDYPFNQVKKEVIKYFKNSMNDYLPYI